MTTLASGALNDPTAPRVRFAPSPTGSLHVGGARTALYNLLFARHTGGTFVLRIEDTDVERSREELTAQILSAMEWLGLEYDEGPFHQSQRGALYQAAVEKLLAEGKAYRAFETPEELDAERKKAEAAGKAYRYSGAGRAHRAGGEPRAAPSPGSATSCACGCRTSPSSSTTSSAGASSSRPRRWTTSSWSARAATRCTTSASASTTPTCGITHVIRGDDHLANTPKHVALFRALGAPVPNFAHLGMILGTDRKKLSKRHGAAAVEEWRDEGILPEALFNFLALLGWAPGGDREILAREEMEREFALDKVGASPSVFDPEKLLWMNSQYIAKMPAAELLRRSLPYAAAGGPDEAVALRAIELHRPRVRTPIEMGRALSSYAARPFRVRGRGHQEARQARDRTTARGARRAARGPAGVDGRLHRGGAARDRRGGGRFRGKAHPSRSAWP